MEIKFVEICDIGKIFEISKEYFDWSIKMLEDSIKIGNIFLKAEEGGEIVGFLLADDLIDSYNLLLIAVKNNYKNKNIATKLIQKLENIAKNKKIEKIWLEVRENNFPAINLYLKNNYKNIYTRRNYYSNGENAIIFEKII